jgi:hypothetical protein
MVVTLRADGVPFLPDRKFHEGSISDYAGCKGARVPGQKYTLYGVLEENGAIVHGIYDQFPEHVAHPSGWRGRVASSNIVDGTSHTFLAGELGTFRAHRRHAFNGDSTGGEWLGLLNPLSDSADAPGLGSDHHEVIHFAFCDASVRPLSPGTDLAIFEALATREGGELTGE